MNVNDVVKWTANDNQGTFSHIGIVSEVSKDTVTLVVPDVGSMTTQLTDGQFEVVGFNEAAIAVEVKQEVNKQVARVLEVAENGTRKSDRVRWRIKQAKANNENEEDVVKWAVETLGMTRALAKSYVKNNWNKV